MEAAPAIQHHGPKTFAAILVILMLSVIDAFLTLDLVHRGASEMNPVMAFYLDQSPLLFFSVKYFLTWAAVLMILNIKDRTFLGTRFRGKSLFVFFIVILALVVQWELVLLHVCFPP
jgi:hypothetical protein